MRNQFLLTRKHVCADRIETELGRACLGEDPIRRVFFFFDMVLNLFGEHLDLSTVAVHVRSTRLKFCDPHLGARCSIKASSSISSGIFPAGRIEDLLFDDRMHHQFGADLLDEPLLLNQRDRAFGAFDLFEQIFDLAVIGLQ